MRNKLFTIITCALFVFILGSCSDSTEGYTRITYYPTITILGETVTQAPIGTTYVDEGATAVEGETDITSSIVTTGNVNTSEIGIYYITYSATNVDGFSSSVTRTVGVYDPDIDIDIAGEYTVADGTYRLTISSEAEVPYSGYPVTITEIAPGLYTITDFLGGYYQYGTGYGSAFAMAGSFRLHTNDTITPLSSYVSGWGDEMDEMIDGKYDRTTGTISWGIAYAGSMIFYVTLEK
ncbi:MAG: DUF5012 domain-containing protein [Tannerellaceae bacterium]|nr:DUF5012 domain-containing protein [Tannerellaceae bacterium]